MIYKLEFLRWKRSGQILILLGLFIISAAVSMTMTYYLKDIMNSMGDKSVKIVVADPNWESLMLSYLKNTSQLMLIMIAYLVGIKCTFGSNESLKLFYTTNGKSAFRVYFPKLLISLSVTILSLLIGGIAAAYIDWAFFEKVNFSHIADSVILQIIGFIIFVSVGIAISVWTNKPFFSAIMVELIVLVSSMFSNVENFSKWSPTTLLQATDSLSKGFIWNHYKDSLLIGIIIFIVSIMITTIRPITNK